MTLIIAFTGYKRSGKDTCSNYISQYYNFKHYKISSKLKAVIKLLFNVSDQDLEFNKETENSHWKITPRKMMQFVGTEMFQKQIQELIPDIQKNFWINSFESSYLINNNENIVISDLRFIHEYEVLRKYNIIVIRIENKRLDTNDDHISENEFLNIPFDYTIKNDGRLSNLYKKIDSVMKIIINYK